jgi:hypothetical protein
MTHTYKIETVKAVFTDKSGEHYDRDFAVKRLDPLPLNMKLSFVERDNSVVLCVDDEIRASVPVPGITNLHSVLLVFP